MAGRDTPIRLDLVSMMHSYAMEVSNGQKTRARMRDKSCDRLEVCDMPAASHKGETLQAAMHGRCRCYRTGSVTRDCPTRPGGVISNWGVSAWRAHPSAVRRCRVRHVGAAASKVEDVVYEKKRTMIMSK